MSSSRIPASLFPGDWLGMLGGGQLGRMFCHAAQSMGYRVAVLDPDPESPAGAVADLHIRASYDDIDGLEQLARRCPAITTEFENVPADTLAQLAERCTVRPSAQAVAITQDRIREKAYFSEIGVPVAPYADIRSADDIAATPDSLYPGILKAARFGYDGKGQITVKTRDQALDAFRELGQVDCVLEAMLPLVGEVSVVLARDHLGNVRCYPPVGNEHRDGILAISTSDVLSGQPALAQQTTRMAEAIVGRLDYIGVLCVEFFVLENGDLIVNEMAPRPHNSGHYTMDASTSSQFEQQVRALAGMPLGDTATRYPAIMINILGDIWFTDDATEPSEPAWDRVLAVPGAHLHLYGKTSVRRGRKMGHVNVVAATHDQARQTAKRVADILRIPFQP